MPIAPITVAPATRLTSQRITRLQELHTTIITQTDTLEQVLKTYTLFQGSLFVLPYVLYGDNFGYWSLLFNKGNKTAF